MYGIARSRWGFHRSYPAKLVAENAWADIGFVLNALTPKQRKQLHWQLKLAQRLSIKQFFFFLTPGHAQKPKPILWWLYCLQVGSQWRSSSQQGNHLGSMRETTTLIFLVLLERLDFNFSLGPHNSSWIGVRHVWQIQGRQFSNIIIRHVCLPKFGTPKVTNPR